jgi:PAS domain S-box-containing protein
MLHAYSFTHPAATIVSSTARRRLIEALGSKVSIDAEFLDLVRVRDPDHEMRTATYVRDKYARFPPDLVMTVGGEALPFILEYRDVIGANIPVVFTSVSPSNYRSAQPPPDVTGIIIALDLENTIRLAEHLQPTARHLYLIAGSAPIDRRWQNTARQIVASRQRKYDTTYLFELPYDELVAQVSRVPPDSIVIMLTVFIDGAGKSLVPGEVEIALANRSPAPFYSPYSGNLGKGALGGYTETFESHGVAAADLALEILSGKDPATLPPRTNPHQAFRVDYNALQRWKLDEGNLPSGTIVMFKPASIWQEHRDFAIAAFSIMALQAAFVVFLLVQRHRRRVAEALLQESEERMAFTAASVNAGFWQYDRNNEELWATPSLRNLLGLKSDVPLTREVLLAAIHPEDREAATVLLRDAQHGNASAVRDVRVTLGDDQLRWISMRARSRPGIQGQVSGIIVDITEQKAAEAEAALQRQEVAHLMRVSLMGELSGAIAHEINQPLTAISTNAHAALDMLPKGLNADSDLRETLHDIVQESHRAAEVINRLRCLLKKGPETSEPVHLNELVHASVRLLRNELIGRRIDVKTELAASLPHALGDPIQVQQVLLNLLMNAMDAMIATPVAQRCITIVTCERQTGLVEVSVRDRGTGIPERIKDRAFEPFYTTKTSGLGLGLAICATISRSHGGTLTLADRAGGGTVATFSIPAAKVLMAAE